MKVKPMVLPGTHSCNEEGWITNMKHKIGCLEFGLAKSANGNRLYTYNAVESLHPD